MKMEEGMEVARQERLARKGRRVGSEKKGEQQVGG